MQQGGTGRVGVRSGQHPVAFAQRACGQRDHRCGSRNTRRTTCRVARCMTRRRQLAQRRRGGGQVRCQPLRSRITSNVHSQRRRIQHCGEPHLARRQLQRRQFGQPLGRAPVACGRQRVQHDTTGQRARGRGVAQHHAVAGPGAQRLSKHDLREAVRARRDAVAATGAPNATRATAYIQHRHRAHRIGRAEVHMHHRARSQRLRFLVPQGQSHVEPAAPRPRRGRHHHGCHQPLPARHVVLGNARQAHGAALTGDSDLHFAVLCTQAAHAHGLVPRHQAQFIAHANGTRMRGAGDHRADPVEREGAVHREPESAPGRGAAAPAQGQRLVHQQSLEVGHAFAARRAYRHHRRALQRAADEQGFGFGAHCSATGFVDTVNLRHHHRAMGQPQQ